MARWLSDPGGPGTIQGGAGGTGAAHSMVNGSQNIPVRAASAAQFVDATFTLIFAADNTPLPFPGFRVPDGCTVRVRANNGTTAGDVAVSFVGATRELLKQGMGKPLAPLDDVACPIDNLCKIWGMGKAGDGLVANVITVGGANS